MSISVEISYYPLNNEFISPIRQFIDRINKYSEIKAVTNGMSTQVFGTYSDVMRILTKEIEISMKNPHSVFIMKLVNADLQN